MLRCRLSYAKIMLISQSDAFYIDSNFFFVFFCYDVSLKLTLWLVW